jgi:tRNA/tmRNA/rRNA uracil-C5-methylase (TrmA/RlmC/RlmD family)
VAAKLGRRFTGIEISPEYVRMAEERIRACKDLAVEGENAQAWNERLGSELKWLYHENKVPTEQLADEPGLLALFTEKFNKRIDATQNPFQPTEVRKHLTQMRKSGKLGPLRGQPVSSKSRKSRPQGTLWENGAVRK